jgi:hypothetical protein
MSVPPLPEIFGNYVLGDFAEVVSPEAISWLPQTAGWAWLGAGLLLLLLRFLYRQLRRWYQNRYRREAAARLAHLADKPVHDAWMIELNSLLKLTALAAYSREQVARLSGKDWVEFLNHHCAAPPFSAELGSLLALGTYTGTAVPEASRQQLLAAALKWVHTHERPEHV